MSTDITTIERDGTTYEVVDGPFVDLRKQVYWFVTDPDGIDQLLWEDEDTDQSFPVPHVDGGGKLVPGLNPPRGLTETVTTWWRRK